MARALLVIAIFAAIAGPAHALEQPLPELRRVVSFGDSDWTVVWRASTVEDRGEFRLYSGPHPLQHQFSGAVIARRTHRVLRMRMDPRTS